MMKYICYCTLVDICIHLIVQMWDLKVKLLWRKLQNMNGRKIGLAHTNIYYCVSNGHIQGICACGGHIGDSIMLCCLYGSQEVYNTLFYSVPIKQNQTVADAH